MLTSTDSIHPCPKPQGGGARYRCSDGFLEGISVIQAYRGAGDHTLEHRNSAAGSVTQNAWLRIPCQSQGEGGFVLWPGPGLASLLHGHLS